jgi:nitroreductase
MSAANDRPHLSVEEVLTTTRAVRRRMDLSRPVEPDLIRECLELALQAPNGSNIQGWHFVVVTDADKRAALADLYRRGGVAYAERAAPVGRTDRHYSEEERVAHRRVMGSAGFLYEHIGEVPAFLIPCIFGRFDGAPLVDQATWFGSILPAVWSFMLAARSRGLGTSWTTVHLVYESEAAAILGIPYETITQVALIPVAHTVGQEFKPADRLPLDRVLHWDTW